MSAAILYAIVACGQRAEAVPVRLVRRHTVVPVDADAARRLLNATTPLGVVIQRPTPRQLAEAYAAWNTFKVSTWLSKANLRLNISTNYRKEN